MVNMAERDGENSAAGAAPAALRTRFGTADVFISYASLDSAVAEAVCGALEREGMTCWVAPRDVVPGEFYADAIVRAIDAASLIVLILSKNAAGSAHVLREVERASSKRHPVVSLRIDLAPLPAALEYFLNTSHWLDASASGVDRALPRLVDAVQRLLAPASTEQPGHSADAPKPVADLSPRLPVSSHASQRLSRSLLALGALIAVALAYLVVEKFWLSPHATSERPIAAVTSAAAPVAVISDKSVAVLPFVDMSEKKDQEYFSDGLSEELIDLLAQVQDLRVPARTSSFYFKGKQSTIAEIAKALGVSHVLEGSVRKAGSTLRVTAQLIRADNGYHLWSKSFDRDVKDIFKVQDEIAAAVVEALKAKLLPAPQLANAYRTTNTEAYNQYLLGNSSLNRGNEDGLRSALQAYRKAIALDPNYAAAYAGLAFSEFFVADTTGDAEMMQRAVTAAERAIALAPDLPLGYLTRGFLRSTHSWDWTGAQADFEKALALDSGAGQAQDFYGSLLASVGRLPEAIAAERKAIELDPLSGWPWENLGVYLMASGQFAAARPAISRALELNPEASQMSYSLGRLELLEGHAQEALTVFRRISHEAIRQCGSAMAEHTLGHVKESQQALDELAAKHARESAYQIAEVYAWRGEKDHAFEWLQRAYAQHDGGLSDIKYDPVLATLRADARYAALLKKLGLPE
jgi:TolB-like protein/lipoprotein NlpI